MANIQNANAIQRSFHTSASDTGTTPCTSCVNVLIVARFAINPMRQNEYDQTWVDGLPVMENGDLMKPTVQSRADAIMAKLHNHIENRKLTDDNRQQHPFRTDR